MEFHGAILCIAHADSLLDLGPSDARSGEYFQGIDFGLYQFLITGPFKNLSPTWGFEGCLSFSCANVLPVKIQLWCVGVLWLVTPHRLQSGLAEVGGFVAAPKYVCLATLQKW